MFLLIFFLQNSPAPAETVLEKYGWTILLLILTNLFNWLLLGRKTASETSKLDAETIKTYIQTINEIQEKNASLFEKMTVFRDKYETVEDVLEETKEKLENCLSRNADCEECHDVLTNALNAFQRVESFLIGYDEAEQLLADIKVLSERIVKRTNGGT